MIGSRFLTHAITVEPYAGASPTGAVYGSPVVVACRVEDQLKMVTDAAGTEVVSTAKVFCDPDVTIPPESKVTVDGRETRVVNVAAFRTDGGSNLDHQEVDLQ